MAFGEISCYRRINSDPHNTRLRPSRRIEDSDMVTTKTLLVILAFVSFTRSVHATDESVEIPGSTKFSESLQTAAASEKALETLYVLIDGHVLLLGREDLVSV